MGKGFKYSIRREVRKIALRDAENPLRERVSCADIFFVS
jgi:hypothetical protein